MAGQYKLFYSNDLKCNLGCGILKIEIFNSTDTTTHDIIMGDQKIVRNKSTYIPTHHFTFSQCKANRFEDKFSQKLHQLKYIHINSYFFNLMGRQLLVKIALCVPKMTSVKKNPLYFQEPRISFCSDRFVHLQL